MPLPDERPRQSVANLIGRFEQQTKRQSLTSAPPRVSTPVSHPTGDTANEEVKERRVWPPVKTGKEKEPEAVSPPLSRVVKSEESSPKPALPTPDASPKPEAADLHTPTPAIDGTSADTMVAPLPTEAPTSPLLGPQAEPEPAATPVEPTPPETSASEQNKIPVPAAGATARPPATPSKLRPVTSRPSAAATAATKTARTLAKSPPASYQGLPANTSSASTPQPLRGSSSLKSIKPTSSRPSSSASVHSPFAPVRPKTPSTARPKTPASTLRPKTPARTPGKALATGLSAPTAASLAKARNAPEVPAQPIKKQALSSDVAERLSKPTAASLSKARSTAPAISAPPKTSVNRGAAPTRGTASTRGAAAVAKPRSSATSAKPKAGVKTPVPSSSPEPVHAEIPGEEPHDDEVYAEDTTLAHEPEEHHDEEAAVEHEYESHVDEESAHEEPDETRIEVPDVSTHQETPLEDEHVQASDTPADAHPESDPEEDVQNLPESPSPAVPKDDDNLVQLVNMLESGMPSPIKLSGFADVAAEIPDEE